jgi:NAD(P)-dependent dehydrogenase (short-subunit alcohol dehydrogenase family)
VIGGGGGIGAGVTLALAEAGIDVAFCDIDGPALGATRAAVEGFGRRTLAVEADATDSAALADFYRQAGAQFDRLDIVVNVVGGVRRRTLLEGSPEEDAADIQRNYGYVVESIRHAIPLIRRGGRGGSIVSFTTIEAHRGAATFAVYAGAKAATVNFTRAMAVELGAERIRVNCIAPDTTNSQGNIQALDPADLAEMGKLPPGAGGQGLQWYIPMKEQPPVEALADAVLFLASDMSRFISGQTLHVDGGTMAAAGMIDWPFGDGHMPIPLAGTLSRVFRPGDSR